MKSELSKSLEKQWKLEQTKREQTSTLAHDIRTPLTIIRGNAELLSDSSLAEKQREYVLHILNNTKRMEQYLNTLIDFTKAESGYSIRPVRIQAEQFIKNIAEQAQGLAATKRIQIQFRRVNLPPVFTADADLLGRAVINVVSNAVEYTPETGIIQITAEGIRGRLRFQITDSGKGFSPADLKQAAAQFYRGDKSRSSKVHYGMGLFIAKSVAEQHGGTLSLANSPETGGGVVTVEIPVRS
jgi:signal transduction histidine kinase